MSQCLMWLLRFLDVFFLPWYVSSFSAVASRCHEAQEAARAAQTRTATLEAEIAEAETGRS